MKEVVTMIDNLINRLVFFLGEFDFFDKTTGPGSSLNKVPNTKLNTLAGKIDDVGMETYDLVFKFSLFSCVISLVGIIVARMIFRIASPREDARAKSFIQTTLVIVFVISMVLTLFQIVIKLGSSL